MKVVKRAVYDCECAFELVGEADEQSWPPDVCPIHGQESVSMTLEEAPAVAAEGGGEI